MTAPYTDPTTTSATTDPAPPSATTDPAPPSATTDPAPPSATTDPAPPSSPVPSEPDAPEKAPSLGQGDLVIHTWDDPVSMSEKSRFGVVVGVVEDSTDDTGREQRGGLMVAWLDAQVSGPLPADLLEKA